MACEVRIGKSAEKQIRELPPKVKGNLFALIKEIEAEGPVRGNWHNYSKLANDQHHCHLKKGRPTYVAVWKVVNDDILRVEVIYAGTHEKAPY
jgi:mRNA-degrading endonuclease RelE of RelBE toxin-antitoxin system